MTQRARFVCGVIEHRANSPLDKGGWSWPFGRVELREEEIFAYTPIFPRRFDVRVPYANVIRAVVEPGRLGGQVRLQRVASATGDVSIVTVNDGYLRIAELLEAKGVHVTTSR